MDYNKSIHIWTYVPMDENLIKFLNLMIKIIFTSDDTWKARANQHRNASQATDTCRAEVNGKTILHNL